MAVPNRRNWQRFERIIAAIEIATSRGAAVTWDERIEGRQFDVVIRFTNGPHAYVTLVECKDQKHPLAVEKVDAFATKARDAKANKAVIICSSGFQSGCLEVAIRHGIDLFRLDERIIEPPGVRDLALQPTHGAYDFVIHFPDGRPPLPIPETNNRLDYLLSHGIITQGGKSESLVRRLDGIMEGIQIAEFDRPQKVSIPLAGAFLEIPTLLPVAPVAALAFTAIKQLKKIGPPSPMDAHLLLKMNSKLELFDCIRQAPVTTIDALDLPIGFDTVMTAGKFYTCMLEQNYYCENVENGSVTLVLVEGYMHGNLVQARMGAKQDVQKYYVEITDLKEIGRLHGMYLRMQLVKSKSSAGRRPRTSHGDDVSSAGN